MKVHVAARSADCADAFLRNNPALAPATKLHVRVDSLASLINKVVHEHDDDYALIVDDDTFYPADFSTTVRALIEELNRNWPSWGVCGNCGISPVSSGLSSSKVVRYLFDRHGGPNDLVDIRPGETIDGNTILLNCKELRRRQVRLPNVSDFQLYDIVISVEALCAGLSVVIAPQLACFYNAPRDKGAFDRQVGSGSFRRYLSCKLANRYIDTINGRIDIPLREAPGPRIDIEMQALRNCAKGRKLKRVAIIVRSQFRSPPILRRTLETTAAFRAAAGEATTFVPFVITDVHGKAPAFVNELAELREVGPFDVKDSRNRLVEEAVKTIDADYLWFIDDDDWMFPNEAERLALVVNCAATNATVFVDCRHFRETPSAGRSIIGPKHRSTSDVHFPASQWKSSFRGVNHIPMCGMILAQAVLRSMPERAFRAVTYLEDYTLQLFAALRATTAPLIVDKLVCGISIRSDQTIGSAMTADDRTVWNQSCAELASMLCQQPGLSILLTQSNGAEQAWQPPLREVLTRGERRWLVSYRMLRGLSRFVLSPLQWRAGARRFAADYRRGGLRGLGLSLCAYEWPRPR